MPKKRTPLWVGLGIVVVLGGGAGAFVALSGDDSNKASTSTQETDPSENTDAVDTTATTAATTTVATTIAPVTSLETTVPPTVAPLTLPGTLPPATSPPDTSSVPPGNLDLTNGVSFALPDGYTVQPSSGGATEIDNGTVKMFVQVLQREPGESVVALIQEYVDTFDSDFESAVYSQVAPNGAETSGAATVDGGFLFYRTLNADGTGVRGVIEGDRRADGLAYITDVYRAIDDKSDQVFPKDTLNEIHQSFLDAPVTGATVALEPSPITRVTTAHQSFQVDGLIEITPPAGWVVDVPGPGRVIFSRPDGQRFLATKVPNVVDLTAAKDLARADTLALVADAQFGDFTDDITDTFAFTSAGWGGTDPNTGQHLTGYISMWVNATGEAYESLEAWVGDTTDPPSVLESDFLFHAFDKSINLPHS